MVVRNTETVYLSSDSYPPS